MSNKIWQTSRRTISYEKTLVMGILNVTPDSFSDGGKFNTIDSALRQAEQMISEGADLLDVGGESTRPNSARVAETEEIRRVVPIIGELSKRFDVPISIDTSKSGVARAAVDAGAEVINDISGLRFDEQIGAVAARAKTGLILMHSRGDFETMHKQESVEHILPTVIADLRHSTEKAVKFGVNHAQIALDIGVGFSKTFSQNLELLARLDEICHSFSQFPILVGTSRKSFIGKILDDAPPDKRIFGTVSTNAIAVFNGANIVRVHDVKAAVEAARVAEAIRELRGNGQDE
jgi:dihydropteroate synthase